MMGRLGIFNRDVGEIALLTAVFELAWHDWRSGNGYAEEAEAFLRDPVMIANLVEHLGMDPDYYRQILDATEHDQRAEREERIRALDEWGLSRTGIAMNVYGGSSSHYFSQIMQVLGPSRRRKKRRSPGQQMNSDPRPG